MKLHKYLIISLMLLFLSVPVSVALSQETNTTELTTQEDGYVQKEKKPKKHSNIIKIDQQFFINFGINLVSVMLILLLIYRPDNGQKHDFIFTVIAFNLIIYLLTFVLNEVKISMGAAFGLFAVFSMLRYRTDAISMKNMTYLFLFIALGLLNAIQLEYYELGIINGLILLITFLLDGNIIFKRESSRNILYEKIELIKPEKKEELMADLKNRTGLNIRRFTIGKIDFLKDSANIKIFYLEKK